MPAGRSAAGVLAGYTEPSMVFLLGTRTVLGGGKHAGEAAARNGAASR